MRPFTLVLLAACVGPAPRPAIAATPAAACAAGKLRAAAQKLVDKSRCHATALRRGGVVDGGCLLRAEARFEAKFAKLESRGGCATVGDAASVEATVDDGLATLVELLPPTTTTTTSTSTTSLPPAVCGNGVREVGEHCDGGNLCTGTCTLQGISYGCCTFSDGSACVAANGFSLNFNMYQFCLSRGASANVPGAICNATGGCEVQAVDPVPLCCQHPDGTCQGTVANSTAGLWYWYNGCEGASFFSSHTVVAASCSSSGTCTPS